MSCTSTSVMLFLVYASSNYQVSWVISNLLWFHVRAENNGRSTDNVQPDRGLDWLNSRLTGHFDRSFLDTNIFFFFCFAQKTSKKKNTAIH